MSINRVVISGNLTRDPEIRSTPSGTNILTFGVAVNDRRRNAQTGEWEDYANFVDCTLFGNRAEYFSRTLRKGLKVVVEGKLRYSSWQDRETGRNRSKLEVVVDDIDFVSPRQQGDFSAPQGGGYGNQGYQNQNSNQGYSQQGGQRQGYSQQGHNYDSQSGQQPSYSSPAPVAPAAPMGNQPQAQPAPAPAPQRPVVTTPPGDDVYDEDIPF
ncbi:MAG: single-stranded DNA-binding protein [Coriobacteriales bacterium]|nr:single-stranded DNA-binding protein [Coriobacteriales bacterium]